MCPTQSFKNIPNDYIKAPQVEHKSAKTPLSEQGGVKEEGSVLWYATDD